MDRVPIRVQDAVHGAFITLGGAVITIVVASRELTVQGR